jgi:hypothetical protein
MGAHSACAPHVTLKRERSDTAQRRTARIDKHADAFGDHTGATRSLAHSLASVWLFCACVRFYSANALLRAGR